MAVLAVAAAGAAIGSALGYTAIGWTVGALLGNALFGPRINQQGPRLTGIRFGQSSYGVGIPIVYGAMRVAGNVIWAGEVEEIASRQKIGKNAYQTSYSYRQSFAVLLCAGPVQGIRRVWLDNRLVYSNAAGDLVEALVNGRLEEQLSIHLGTDDQLPDAVIEAEAGAGNVPAYRDACYLVFERFDLTSFGNRIPSVTAEVVESAAYTAPTLVSEIPVGVTGKTAKLFGADLVTGQWIGGGRFQATYQVRDPATGAVRATEVYASAPLSPLVGGTPSPCLNDPRIAYADMADPDPPVIDPGPPPVYEETARGVWLLREMEFDPDTGTQYPGVNVANQFPIGTTLQAIDYCLRMGEYLYAIGATTVGGISSGNPPVLRAFALNADAGWVATAPAFTFEFSSVDTIAGGGAPWLATDGTHLYVRWTGLSSKGWSVWKLTWDLQLVEEITGLPAYATPFAVWDGMLLGANFLLLPNYQPGQWRLNGDGTVTLMGTGGTRPLGGAFFPTFLALGGGAVLADDGEWTMVPALAPAGRTLAQVVTAVCGEAGLGAGEIDVTDIAGITVDGYLLDRRLPARAALEPLLAAYAVEAVESAGKLRFVRRGGAPVATVTQAQLGAAVEESAADDPALVAVREHESVLPQRVDVNYSDLDGGYEIGTQTATRGTVRTEEQLTVDLPLAMAAADAAQTAHRLLYDAWAARTRREFATSLRWAHLEPTDVVWLEDDDGLLTRVRLLQRTEDDGVLRWVALADDDGTPLQYAAGAPRPAPPGLALPAGNTQAVLFEVPPLRDEHASAIGLYAAATSFTAAWPGAGLWSHTPGDTDYALVAPLTVRGTLGQAMAALPAAWPGQADPRTIDVRLAGGADPETVTESAWLGGRNLLLLGGELLRFRTATPISGGWRLAGLLRGQHGTDYAAATHAAGEPAVLLDDLDTAHWITRPSSQIGVARSYRTPTAGQLVEDAPPAPFALHARTLRPLPPVHVTIVRQANGDRTIRWHRRTRAWQDWREDADIPMLEAAESYRVEIRRADTGALLRSATVSTPAVTYTAAQITADLGALPPTHIRVRVMQQSALVGDGEPADVTLPWAGDYNAHYARDWDDLSAAGMTAFGASPELSTSTIGVPQGWPADSKTAFLRQNHASTNDVKARFDRLGNFADGLLRVKTNKIYDIFGTNKRAGLVARTTHWRNAIGGFGYAVEFLHDTPGASIRLVRGTNSDSGTITQIGSIVSLGTTATSPSEIAWLLAGSSHKVWVDGVLRIDTTDSTHPGAGGCGLYLHGQFQNAANFDDFTADYRST